MDQDVSLMEFNSMAELTAYLSQLENRVAELERENESLQTSNHAMTEKTERIYKFFRRLSTKKIFSNNFFVRAIAIWVHNFIVELILGFVLTALLAIIYFAFFATTIPPVLQNLP